jgi:hypothetical protein
MINSHGLRSGTYLTRSLPRAAIYGGAILKVKVPKENLGWSEPGDYVLLKRVPPEKLTLVKKFSSNDDAIDWGDSRWIGGSSYDDYFPQEFFKSLGGLDNLRKLPEVVE